MGGFALVETVDGPEGCWVMVECIMFLHRFKVKESCRSQPKEAV